MQEQITSLQKYVMQKTGGLNLSAMALQELGWERGKASVDLYSDLKRKRLILVKSGESVEDLPKGQIGDVESLSRSASIGVLGFITVDKWVRQKLGWELGGKFRQTLDRSLKGIIIKEAEESENG